MRNIGITLDMDVHLSKSIMRCLKTQVMGIFLTPQIDVARALWSQIESGCSRESIIFIVPDKLSAGDFVKCFVTAGWLFP